ncbi:indole-3-glycerol phosphate synthase [Pullulanibacillus camelliae]|uniref:Indole-3-glycerol phosphate synthase n=1 Tax=Pullulanibacillus camelliae TaxID=1707096 RepID=A0A8J2VUS1_9BACL|nr:indole-3-glycerol phosphate synthase TrpC [Pullulanibacillus camelliae]GGE38799.1 indole-3-glycerol phosphate synthase [Pullulanibacillus camelliae]
MLKEIIQHKKEELENYVFDQTPFTGERVSLKAALLTPHHEVGLIAEVKQASPSKGTFTHSFDPIAIAKSYEDAGADAISVLTDKKFFKGSPMYLKQVKATVTLPVLRKDFIIDERQIAETLSMGADAMLLIAAALSPKKLYEFYQRAYENGLECLVEVHNKEELAGVLSVFQPEIIGINNRDLKTFNTTLDTTEAVLPYVPKDSVVVSESGILTAQDIERLSKNGIHGALVGEALMKAETPEKGIQGLFEVEMQ